MNKTNYIPGMIEALLTAIDNCDWDSLSKLLSDDTVYEVSGFPRFEGREAVMDYYENIRPIESGEHTINSIVILSLSVETYPFSPPSMINKITK